MYSHVFAVRVLGNYEAVADGVGFVDVFDLSRTWSADSGGTSRFVSASITVSGRSVLHRAMRHSTSSMTSSSSCTLPESVYAADWPDVRNS